MLDHVVKAYNETVFETGEEAAFAVVEAALTVGAAPEEIVFEVVIPAVGANVPIYSPPSARLPSSA